MAKVISIRSSRYNYSISHSNRNGWTFERTSKATKERFPLDHDERHQRLLLGPKDQRRVGVEGLVALERMTREILPR